MWWCKFQNYSVFFAIQEDNKILRESYETNFIEKFKPTLNKRQKEVTANIASTAFKDKTSLLWDLIYAHKYLTS